MAERAPAILQLETVETTHLELTRALGSPLDARRIRMEKRLLERGTDFFVVSFSALFTDETFTARYLYIELAARFTHAPDLSDDISLNYHTLAALSMVFPYLRTQTSAILASIGPRPYILPPITVTGPREERHRLYEVWDVTPA